jgi:hypothetical protein
MLTPYPQVEFGGLDLRAAPDSSACIDMLNVELDRPGAVRARDGFDNFTSVAEGARITNLAPFYSTDGDQLLVAVNETDEAVAYTTAGAVSSSQALAATTGVPSLVRWGTTGTGGDSIIVLPGNGAASYIYNGAWSAITWSAYDGDEFPLGAISPNDNRLALSGSTNEPGAVFFSNPGDFDTVVATNFVYLHPGDGHNISALANWGELLFAFKPHKFFVFYGNSTDTAGNPVFNYRAVNTGVGAVGSRAVATGRDALYFVSRRGVYRTRGGEPELVSAALDPLFTGQGISSFCQVSAINQAQVSLINCYFVNERLYVGVPTGSNTYCDKTLVFDPRTDQWMVWDVPMGGISSFRIGDAEDLVFSYATGSNHIGRFRSSSPYTDDDGTAIVSRYRSGFSDYGSPYEKSVDATQLWGVGTPNFRWSADFGSLDTAQAVTLGTSPAIASGWHRYGRRGTLLSWEVGASSGAWTLHRAVPHIEASGTPTDQTTA